MVLSSAAGDFGLTRLRLPSIFRLMLLASFANLSAAPAASNAFMILAESFLSGANAVVRTFTAFIKAVLVVFTVPRLFSALARSAVSAARLISALLGL